MNKIETPAQVSTTSEVWECTKAVAVSAATVTGTAFCVACGTVAAYLLGAKVGQWMGIVPNPKS